MTNVIEFEYLDNLIDYRLNNPSGQEIPPLPEPEIWSLPIKDFIANYNFAKNQYVSTLLLIGLAPHAVPELFDHAIQEKLRTSGDFPEIGGVRGKNFRGFLPTGQTAVFLLAGDDVNRRAEVEKLFWSDNDFAKRKILWLEDLPAGEPTLSGKITMAHDYIDLFLFGTAAPPHFGINFPAKKITTELTSDDIVMNNDVKRHYKSLRQWIDYNPALMDEWKMQKRLRKGYRVLFYGPPGTGKTLTANVLGNETQKDVYKIDLSMVVSKYIGETEKNLEKVFVKAEHKNWILFFDEADALFGKRTAISDAHDKYANQEIAYLLQRLEDYNGLVILSSNMRSNVDEAFGRRLQSVIYFPVPKSHERLSLWQNAFSTKTTLSDDLDLSVIADKYEIAGGSIINVVQYASLMALHRGESVIRQRDVLEGIRKEFRKDGKTI